VTDREVVLVGEALTKHYPGVTALSRVPIECRANEVLALVGENGAGKSTLVGILTGVIRPDTGSLQRQGQALSLGNPHHARREGICAVYQELSLLPALTVGENILLGREPRTRCGFLDGRRLHAVASQVLDRLGTKLDPYRLVGSLSPAERQLVEIAKALATEPKLLILDEPTSSLSNEEAGRLLTLVEELKQQGLSILFISHRLDEVLRISDRIMVLKDGEHVATEDRAELTRDALVSLMVGRKMEQIFPERAAAVGAPLLELNEASARGHFSSVSIVVRAGEIIGLGGLEGQGQRGLVRALFGVLPLDVGDLRIHGNPVRLGKPADAIARGLAFIPDDRKLEGLVLPLGVDRNIVLAALTHISRGGLLNMSAEAAVVAGRIAQLDIKTPAPSQPVSQLSGGNQQKVVLAKWLETNPDVLILHEPTRGIDVETKVEIYALLRELAAKGKGVLILTGDMLELIGLADRIYVMYEGRISGEIPGVEASEERLMQLSSGAAA